MEQLIKCNSFSKLEMQVSDAVPSYEYKDSGGGVYAEGERYSCGIPNISHWKISMTLQIYHVIDNFEVENCVK